MCLAGLLEYTWGTVARLAPAAHHWSLAPDVLGVLLLRDLRVVRPDLHRDPAQPRDPQRPVGDDHRRHRLRHRRIRAAGRVDSIWQAYLGYAVLGGIGSGMVYSSCINIVAKWYPEKKGWRTGFVNGGWAYGAVPFIIVIGGISGAALNMSPGRSRPTSWVQGLIMTVGIALAGLFMKDPPKNWWPKEIDPLNWHKHSTRDLRHNPPALRHYNGRRNVAYPAGQMDRHPVRPVHRLLPVRRGLLLPVRHGHGPRAAGRPWPGLRRLGSRSDRRAGRPVYGYISEFIGRRQTMIYAYSGNVVFQLPRYFAGSDTQRASVRHLRRSSRSACPVPTSR